MSTREMSLTRGHLWWLLVAVCIALGAVVTLCLGLGGEALAEANAPATVWIDPPTTVYEGSIFTVAVAITDAVDLRAYEFVVGFEPSVVTVTAGADAGFIPSPVFAVSEQGPDTFFFGATSTGMGDGVDGDGSLAVLTLEAVGVGTSNLALSDVQLLDSQSMPETPAMESGAIEVVEAPAASDLVLEADPQALLVGETSYLAATVFDGDAVPLPLKQVVFTTDFGALGSSVVTRTTDGFGRAYAELTAPAAGTATVTAVADGVSDTVEVVFADTPASRITVHPQVLTVTLPPGDSTSRTLEIGNAGDADLEWTLAQVPPVDWLSASPTSGTEPPTESTDVTVDFDATGLADGIYTTTLEISTNEPDEDPVVVPVTLTVQTLVPDITVSPDALAATLSLGGSTTRMLTIGNVGDADLTWTLTKIPDAGWLSASPTGGTVAPGGDTDVTVGFDATGLAVGIYQATLQITSNDPDQSPLSVPVTLTVGKPSITVSPAALSATLSPGESTNRTLTIGNAGAADLLWTLAETPAVGWLSAAPTSGTESPGQSTDVTVTFDATGLADGTYNTTLRINSNDPDDDPVDVPVTLIVESEEPDEFYIFLPLVGRQAGN